MRTVADPGCALQKGSETHEKKRRLPQADFANEPNCVRQISVSSFLVCHASRVTTSLDGGRRIDIRHP